MTRLSINNALSAASPTKWISESHQALDTRPEMAPHNLITPRYPTSCEYPLRKYTLKTPTSHIQLHECERRVGLVAGKHASGADGGLSMRPAPEQGRLHHQIGISAEGLLHFRVRHESLVSRHPLVAQSLQAQQPLAPQRARQQEQRDESRRQASVS